MTGAGVGTRPLVSAIVPTYDRPGYLGQAVESVRAQTYDEIELIVVDDHSPTPASSTIETGDDRLRDERIIRHETNRGANAARNTGIKDANGDLLAFLDDDDRWLPEKIERQVDRFLAADDTVGMVYTGAKEVNEAGEVVSVARPTVRGDVTESIFRGAVFGGYSRVMVRRSVVDEAGLLDERFPSWQDREWYLRLSECCLFEVISDPLVVMTSSADQISDHFERKRDVAYPLFIEKHRPLAASYGPVAERRFLASLSHTLGSSGLRNGYHREAAKYLVRSLRYWPFSWRTWAYLGLAVGGSPAYSSAKQLKRLVTKLTT